MNEPISTRMIQGLTFLACIALVSYWIGGITLSTWLVIPISLALFYFLFLKNKITIRETIPLSIIGVAGLVLVLTAAPLLFVNQFYDVSTDALHTINVRILQGADKIPLTNEPYSSLPLLYNLGFHLAAKPFVDILGGIPDYLVLWALGLFLAALQPLLLFLFLRKMGAETLHAETATLLLLGTKTLFTNFFTGLYPWMMATNLFLLFFILYREKDTRAFLIWPILFLVHPGVALYASLFFGIYTLFMIRKNGLAEIHYAKWIIPSMVLALPALPSYLNLMRNPFGTNVFQGNLSQSLFEMLLSKSTIILLWIGLVPVLALGGLGILYLSQHAKDSQKKIEIPFFIFLVSVLAAGGAFLYFSQRQNPLDNKMIELMTLSVIGMIAFLPLPTLKPSMVRWAKIILIVGCLAVFATSGQIQKVTIGSKFTPTLGEFATGFQMFDPEVKSVFYFSDYGAKISQYANKTPYDITRGLFISPIAIFAPEDLEDPAYKKILNQEKEWKTILASACFSCAKKVGVDYIVVERARFPGITNEIPVFSKNGFDVYRI